jgi:hypothetical protein
MPYIIQERRDTLEDPIQLTAEEIGNTSIIDIPHRLAATVNRIVDNRVPEGRFKKLEQAFADLPKPVVNGDINYALCEILMRAFKLDTEPRYSKIDAVMQILESMVDRTTWWLIGTIKCVQAEIYRVVAVPYEKYAAIKNGDISSFVNFRKTLRVKFTEVKKEQGFTDQPHDNHYLFG